MCVIGLYVYICVCVFMCLTLVHSSPFHSGFCMAMSHEPTLSPLTSPKLGTQMVDAEFIPNGGTP